MTSTERTTEGTRRPCIESKGVRTMKGTRVALS